MKIDFTEKQWEIIIDALTESYFQDRYLEDGDFDELDHIYSILQKHGLDLHPHA